MDAYQRPYEENGYVEYDRDNNPTGMKHVRSRPDLRQA